MKHIHLQGVLFLLYASLCLAMNDQNVKKPPYTWVTYPGALKPFCGKIIAFEGNQKKVFIQTPKSAPSQQTCVCFGYVDPKRHLWEKLGKGYLLLNERSIKKFGKPRALTYTTMHKKYLFIRLATQEEKDRLRKAIQQKSKTFDCFNQYGADIIKALH